MFLIVSFAPTPPFAVESLEPFKVIVVFVEKEL